MDPQTLWTCFRWMNRMWDALPPPPPPTYNDPYFYPPPPPRRRVFPPPPPPPTYYRPYNRMCRQRRQRGRRQASFYSTTMKKQSPTKPDVKPAASVVTDTSSSYSKQTQPAVELKSADNIQQQHYDGDNSNSASVETDDIDFANTNVSPIID